MKTFLFYLSILMISVIQASAQEDNFLIGEMKIAAKSREGKFYNYFLIIVPKVDTFQVIQVTGKRKSRDQHQFDPAMLAVLDFKQGKLIDEKLYVTYSPFLKRKLRAYFFDKVGLIYL